MRALRLSVCILVLSATAALAQVSGWPNQGPPYQQPQYAQPGARPPGYVPPGHRPPGTGRRGPDHRMREHEGGPWGYGAPPALVIAPGMVMPMIPPPGLPPTGFSYQCPAPAGLYPMVRACRMPWRMVPGGRHR